MKTARFGQWLTVLWHISHLVTFREISKNVLLPEKWYRGSIASLPKEPHRIFLKKITLVCKKVQGNTFGWEVVDLLFSLPLQEKLILPSLPSTQFSVSLGTQNVEPTFRDCGWTLHKQHPNAATGKQRSRVAHSCHWELAKIQVHLLRTFPVLPATLPDLATDYLPSASFFKILMY